jgi:hypothetical protein
MSDHTKSELAAMTTDRDAWERVADEQRKLAIEHFRRMKVLEEEVEKLKRENTRLLEQYVSEANKAEKLRSSVMSSAERDELEALRADRAARMELIERLIAEVKRLKGELGWNAEIVATYSPCCGILRLGRHDGSVMHTGLCDSAKSRTVTLASVESQQYESEIKRLRGLCIRLIVEASRAESLASGGFDVVEAIRELREAKK